MASSIYISHYFNRDGYMVQGQDKATLRNLPHQTACNDLVNFGTDQISSAHIIMVAQVWKLGKVAA